MLVRPEKFSDHDAVRLVNLDAFPTPSEANLVDALREQATPVVSLVAEENETIVGHIMFSPVSIVGHHNAKVMGLAPMGVATTQQKKGVGSALVRAGIEQCKELGVVAVVVLGHPEYYPRFGFLPASEFGMDSEFDVPDGVFMAMELVPDALTGQDGRVRYHAAFADV